MLNECAEYFSVALLTEAMIDSEGNLKDYDQWVKDTASINAHYNKAWLRTEYDTAVLRAQMAADWKQFEADADVLPNLKWMPTTSVTPREQHRVFWSEGLTLPIDDPFWNKHRPGDLWNCKCWLEQTDEPATAKKDLPKESEMPSPMPGLEGNPAKTEEIFSQDHPHFPTSCASCLLNMDGKVHGLKGVKNVLDVERRMAKGDCGICDVQKICKGRLEAIADPKTNPNLIPEEGYEDTLFVHIDADKKDKEDNIREAKHILDKGFPHLSAIVINHDIKSKDLANQEYTFIYKDGRKLYGDRKGVKGETGITTSFSTAVNEQCDKVIVIEYNTQAERINRKLNIDKMASKILGRISDFESGKIYECYIIRNEYVVKIDKEFMQSGGKRDLKSRLIDLLSPLR